MDEDLIRAITRINSRLDEIEQRLDEIQFQRVILDESRIVEGEGMLGGRTYFAGQTGEIQKLIRVPVCDSCGQIGKYEFICHHCEKKLCRDCIIIYENTAHCLDCLRRYHIDLSKKAWKVLRCIADGVTIVSTISGITKMLREEVITSMAELQRLGFIVKDGWIIKRYRITEDGLVAMNLYDRIYGPDPDSYDFLMELKDYAP